MNNLKAFTQFAQLLKQLFQSYLTAKSKETPSAELPSLNQLFTINQLHEYPIPPTLKHLTELFNLNPFEQWVILLCTALELEPKIGICCAQLQGNDLNQPTPDFALNLLPQPIWQAFNSNAPLLHWQLIQLKDTQPFSLSPLSINRPLFFWLIGEAYHDPKLDGFIHPLHLNPPIPLTPSQAQLAQTLSQNGAQPQHPPLQQLIGNDPQAHRAILHTAAQQQSYTTHIAKLSTFSHNTPLTNDPHLLRNLARRWERAARLTKSLLLLDCQDVDMAKPTSQITLETLLAEWQTPVILSATEPIRLPSANSQTHEVPTATSNEREMIWLHCLGEQASPITATLAQIADQFPLTPYQIAHLASQLPQLDTPQDLSQHLWSTCRQAARPQLQDLAELVTTRLTLDDLD